MEYSELRSAFRAAKRALSYTYNIADLISTAARIGDEERLLSELETVQYLKPKEIASLFGVLFEEVIADISPIDLVFTMKTLIHLRGWVIKSEPCTRRDWDQVEKCLPVGTIADGQIVRQIAGGYVVGFPVEPEGLNSFLPDSEIGDRKVAVGMTAQFRIAVVDRKNRHIQVTFP